MTYTFNCTLIHISSAISTDHITIKLANGIPITSYNLGYKTHQIAFRRPKRVNDGNYHKLRFNRFGQNSTLQLDSNWTINLHPKSKTGIHLFTVFNAHSHIRLGGIDNQQQLNYDYLTSNNNNDEFNQEFNPEFNANEDDNLETSALLNKNRLNERTKLNYVSNQIVNSLTKFKSSNHQLDHFIGVMMNVIVNSYSILEMAAKDNPNVIVSGDVQLLTSLPKSSIHKFHKQINQLKQQNQLDSKESIYIKRQKDLNRYRANHKLHNKHKDLLDLMQGDQVS